jgi:hypothetical protein
MSFLLLLLLRMMWLLVALAAVLPPDIDLLRWRLLLLLCCWVVGRCSWLQEAAGFLLPGTLQVLLLLVLVALGSMICDPAALTSLEDDSTA